METQLQGEYFMESPWGPAAVVYHHSDAELDNCT